MLYFWKLLLENRVDTDNWKPFICKKTEAKKQNSKDTENKFVYLSRSERAVLQEYRTSFC